MFNEKIGTMDKFSYLKEELCELETAGLLRKLRCIESVKGVYARFAGGQPSEKLLLCSNNYLNLASHPKIIAAAVAAVEEYGYGGGASRLVSGTIAMHRDVENRFAEFFGKEAALFFPSGWSANEGLLRTIPQKGDLVLLDKLDHASIVDGSRAGQADFRTFRRDEPDKLARLLKTEKYARKFIVTESIFSMDGDRADLKRLVELKAAHDAILIVDEAHALGCFGANGKGLAEEAGVLDQIDIIVAPMGKAMAAAGAIIAARQVVIDYLINKARSFIYTTAAPPATCAAVSAGLEIILNEPQRRQKLADNAAYLRARLHDAGLDSGASTSQIVPVIIGDDKKTMAVSQALFEKGFFVAPIRPPTVPQGTARLRVSVQYEHTTQQFDEFITALIDIMKEYGSSR